MPSKLKVYLASNIFTENEIGSNEIINLQIRNNIKSLWEELREVAEIKVFNGRFPDSAHLKNEIDNFKPHIVGCHLSHEINVEMLNNSDIFAVLTSSAGYNHIHRTNKDDILITHTPGVLHETVADYAIALILANLRNIPDLHNYVWDGHWTANDKWDLDQSLSSIIKNKVIGIIGLGEIGLDVVKKLYPWDLKIIYYDLTHHPEFEKQYPQIEYKQNITEIFRQADIISLHIPLNKSTENIVNQKLLKIMKKGALLINTARGGIINFNDLLNLMEKKEIQINLAFDVYPEEPLNPIILERFKRIKKEQPYLRIILMPHNASADADTRGKMVILFLEDLIKIIKSNKIEDLENVHLIPEHKKQLENKNWQIYKYWKEKK
jgi:lactate dehydrogenase-like 2-hydroxyacid dehydrogenase